MGLKELVNNTVKTAIIAGSMFIASSSFGQAPLENILQTAWDWHSNNPEGASLLREQVDKTYKCNWLPTGPMSLVLGAHTGPSMVGVGYGLEKAFADIP